MVKPGLRTRVEAEMHERVYRRPGTAFRSNRAELLKGFRTVEERQIAKEWLDAQEPYVLSRTAHLKFPRSKTVTSGIDDICQMDLADMTKLADENDGYRFMLTVIDVFSWWAWAEPVKSKSAADMVKALKAVFHRAGAHAGHSKYRLTKGWSSTMPRSNSCLNRKGSKHITAAMIRTPRPAWWRGLTAQSRSSCPGS